MSRKTHSSAADCAPDCAPDSDRRGIATWVYVGVITAGIWVLAPIVVRFVSLAVGDTLTLTLSRPDNLTAPDGVQLLGLAAQVPVSELDSGARTAVLVGNSLELSAVVAMLVAVTVVMRAVRPGGVLRNRTKLSAIVVACLAGLVGMIGVHVMTSAGVLACADLYGSCTAGRTWSDPLAIAFPLAGIGLALIFALVRSETAARRNAEGLV